MSRLAVGDEAPNFDLTSTEDVVLMLRDEVPRTAVLLYFFAVADDRGRGELSALAAAARGLARRRTRILGVTPLKPEEAKELQRELALSFPLLSDDRDFARHYGVAAAGDEPAPPALFLVDRELRVVWLANPLEDVGAALGEVEKAAAELPAPTANLPRSVVNRVVNWWVNVVSRRRPAGSAG